MTLLSIVDSKHPCPATREQAALPIRCKRFGPGREDWNRGLRELRWTMLRDGWLSRLADGTIRLHGVLGVDLRLHAAEVERSMKEGLQIGFSDFEIDISADAFGKALAALPASGTVLPFLRRN